jgi:naphthoate synthase
VTVSEIFDATQWAQVPGSRASPTSPTTGTPPRDATAWWSASRSTGPEVRNAFRPHTVDELHRVLDHARRRPTSAACCSPATGRAQGRRLGVLLGGDQRIRGRDGYRYASDEGAESIDPAAPVGCTSWRCSG